MYLLKMNDIPSVATFSEVGWYVSKSATMLSLLITYYVNIADVIRVFFCELYITFF